MAPHPGSGASLSDDAGNTERDGPGSQQPGELEQQAPEPTTPVAPRRRLGLRFWKKNEGRASMTNRETALIGRYTQVSDLSNVPFKRSRPPEPRPVVAAVPVPAEEVPQPTHYWYDETENPVVGKSEVEGGTTSSSDGRRASTRPSPNP